LYQLGGSRKQLFCGGKYALVYLSQVLPSLRAVAHMIPLNLCPEGVCRHNAHC